MKLICFMLSKTEAYQIYHKVFESVYKVRIVSQGFAYVKMLAHACHQKENDRNGLGEQPGKSENDPSWTGPGEEAWGNGSSEDGMYGTGDGTWRNGA